MSIFIDYQKAFDAVNHSILLRKLEKYGVRGNTLNLFKDYLTNRYQSVRIGEVVSGEKEIKIGVPQGSVMGSLLFIIYINDFPNISNSMHCTMYADDTTVSFKNASVSELYADCNETMVKVYNWMISNRLSINMDKTCYMLLTTRKCDFNNDVYISSNVIKRETCVKFLGIMFDDNMKFKSHFTYLSGKISKTVGILNRIKDFVPYSTMITLYNSLIYPYLLYCNLVWGGTFHTNLAALVILQKKAIRIIHHKPYGSHTKPLFFQSKLLNLFDIHNYLLGIYMYNAETSEFTRTHLHYTRNRDQLLPRFHRLALSQKSISYSGPIFWNSLPNEVKTCRSLNTFKSNLKKYLISKYMLVEI